MTIVETLRARFRPEWKSRADFTGLDAMFETALSFIAAPKLKRSALEKPGTLNSRGVAVALRQEVAKYVLVVIGAQWHNPSRRTWCHIFHLGELRPPLSFPSRRVRARA
jgi:hypothetical protein